jgi:hypothetical protein
MAIRPLLCFGGPNEGETITTFQPDVLYVPRRPDLAELTSLEPADYMPRTERYDVVRFRCKTCGHRRGFECLIAACPMETTTLECLVWHEDYKHIVYRIECELSIVAGIAFTMGMA